MDIYNHRLRNIRAFWWLCVYYCAMYLMMCSENQQIRHDQNTCIVKTDRDKVSSMSPSPSLATPSGKHSISSIRKVTETGVRISKSKVLRLNMVFFQHFSHHHIFSTKYLLVKINEPCTQEKVYFLPHSFCSKQCIVGRFPTRLKYLWLLIVMCFLKSEWVAACWYQVQGSLWNQPRRCNLVHIWNHTRL